MGGCCPYRTAFDLLSKRHAMTILWLLQETRPLRFTQLKIELAVNPVTLAQRLGELERAGVLSRREFRETPPRVEYDLTEKGMDLLPLIEQACEWAKRWDCSPIRA